MNARPKRAGANLAISVFNYFDGSNNYGLVGNVEVHRDALIPVFVVVRKIVPVVYARHAFPGVELACVVATIVFNIRLYRVNEFCKLFGFFK